MFASAFSKSEKSGFHYPQYIYLFADCKWSPNSPGLLPALPRLHPAPAHPGSSSTSREKLGNREPGIDFLTLTLKTAEVEREKQPSLLHKIFFFFP